MPDELHEYLESKRAAIKRGLRASLKLIEDAPVPLREAIEYGLLAPGKRLRPLLVILAAEACGGTCDQAMSAAAAVEMIHAYSLIHDDLPPMDDDDLRRGQPTCHVRFGEALAILAGDALLTLAFQILAEGYPARTATACCRELSRAAGASGMVGGQVADLMWEGRIVTPSSQDPNMADLEMVHSRKTGALFQACLRLGACSVHGERPDGVPGTTFKALDAYGRCFGQAFQITDDLLDAEGSTEQTGKRVGKDAAKGKLTYPALVGADESRRLAEHLCAEAFEHASKLGQSGKYLAAISKYVLHRDR